MSTHTMVRAVVRTEVADAARLKAETAGKTLADLVGELLAAYVEPPRKRARKR